MADTFAVGGRGTMADAIADNGGGYVSGSAAGWTTFQGANGGALHIVTGASYATATGVITKAGEFAVGLTGVLVHTKEGAAGAWAEAWHAITASDSNSITIASGLGDNTDIDVWVGGAWLATDVGIQAALDLVAAGDTIKISNAGTHTLGASVTVDGATGTAGSNITVEGVVAATGVQCAVTDTLPVITTGSTLADGLFKCYEATKYYKYYCLEFDGAKDDGVRATYCVSEDGIGGIQGYGFYGCLFHDAESSAVYWGGTARYHLIVVDCEIFDNGGSGIGRTHIARNCPQVFNCSIHDNGGNGIEIGAFLAYINGNLIYNNAGHGIDLAASEAVISNNVLYGNDDGLYVSVTSVYRVIIYNNTAVFNRGYGFNLNGMVLGEIDYFGHNHAYDNDQDEGIAAGGDYCSECASEAIFQAFGNGNNRTGDPKFASVVDGSEDFTPGTGSDLIGNALNGGDIGALQSVGGGGGGLLTHPGMSGGMRG